MAGFMKMKGLAALLGVGTTKAGNTGGALVNMRYTDVFSNPPVVPTSEGATCTLVTTVAASNAALGVDLTIVTAVEATLRTQPRNLTIWASAGQTEALNVTGYDQFGTAQTENITFNGNAAVHGTKVWGAITTIHQVQRSGAADIGVGLGSIFGTSRVMNGLAIDGAVYTTSSGASTAVQETTRPVKAPTASVYGVTFGTAIAATKTYVVSYGSSEVR
jgi:hypothetical protein